MFSSVFYWDVLRNRVPRPVVNYSILAAVFGHFFLLSNHAKQIFEDFLSHASYRLYFCSHYTLSTETKLMILYYSFFLAGAASVIIKFFCPSFIKQYETLGNFSESNQISKVSEIEQHYVFVVSPFLWRRFTKRHLIQTLQNIRDEARVIAKSTSPDDHRAVCSRYKAAWFKFYNRSLFWAPLGNILIAMSMILLLATALSVFSTITCILVSKLPSAISWS